GAWSTFWAQVGTPPQNVRLLPATGGTSIWVVVPAGCISEYGPKCDQNRGGLFLSNESTSWDQIGLYVLNLFTEEGLGYYGNALYGFETVTLGDQGSGLPTLQHQVVGGIALQQFWLGTLPLEPWPVNFTSQNDPQDGLLTSLKKNQDIGSLSWGYTAGGNARSPQVLGSLTLGGYDASRFEPSGVTFGFGGDISRDLLIPIPQIQTSNGFRYSQNQFYFIDSLVPDLWLPDEACTVFEKAFSLTYDNDTQMYLVSKALREQLLGQNNSVTFTIGPGNDINTGNQSDKTFTITLPYWAFDLAADIPLTPNSTHYFPLRRASDNATQYTLGRTFLQAAYVVADYESGNFSVNAALFPEQGAQEQLVPILAKLTQTAGPTNGSGDSSSSLGGGAIAGIVIGAIAAIAIVGLAAFFIWRKKRRQ
ncbi:acid protease, partial [Rhizodiscina lignyota]